MGGGSRARGTMALRTSRKGEQGYRPRDVDGKLADVGRVGQGDSEGRGLLN